MKTVRLSLINIWFYSFLLTIGFCLTPVFGSYDQARSEISPYSLEGFVFLTQVKQADGLSVFYYKNETDPLTIKRIVYNNGHLEKVITEVFDSLGVCIDFSEIDDLGRYFSSLSYQMPFESSGGSFDRIIQPNSIFDLPAFPFFVVISTTPFEAREP